jgi:hypothetical protein
MDKSALINLFSASAGLFSIVYGLFKVSSPDLMWKWEEYKAKIYGVTIQRPLNWDRDTRITGYLFIALGIIWILVVYSI